MAIEAGVRGPRRVLDDLVRGARDVVPHPPPEASADSPAEVSSRLRWYAAIAPVTLRMVLLPCAATVLAAVDGLRRTLPLLGVVAALAAVDAIGLRAAGRSRCVSREMLYTSLGLAVAANLLVAGSVPADTYLVATSVTGAHLIATVVVWTLSLGGWAGMAVVGGNVALQAVMVELNHAHDGAPIPHVLAFTAAGTVGLAAAVGLALIDVAVLAFGARLAMTVGMQAGREAERAVLLRGMHDTVLQTLEAIALYPAGEDGEQTIDRLRGMARGQAMQIRQALGTVPVDVGAMRFADELLGLAAELSADGLRIELALDDIPDDVLSTTGRAALRDAAREALRNVAKHSGADAAVLRLTAAADAVHVVVRDHGCGFDPLVTPAGFGMRESIGARLREVDGQADVWSRPGRGVRVTLRVPMAGQ
ncbi:MAG TPA: ATP-binding protein [Jatrophihabitans sp.]|nr:ATP-binding protein [Jatrophihabitans sp.]